MEERYNFDEASYDAIARAGLEWQDVLYVLNTKPVVRQHIGAVLRIAAVDRHDRWRVVALIEEEDDHYLVVSARLLDAAEIAAVEEMLRGGGQR
jgi:hypothetical protein